MLTVRRQRDSSYQDTSMIKTFLEKMLSSGLSHAVWGIGMFKSLTQEQLQLSCNLSLLQPNGFHAGFQLFQLILSGLLIGSNAGVHLVQLIVSGILIVSHVGWDSARFPLCISTYAHKGNQLLYRIAACRKIGLGQPQQFLLNRSSTSSATWANTSTPHPKHITTYCVTWGQYYRSVGCKQVGGLLSGQ